MKKNNIGSTDSKPISQRENLLSPELRNKLQKGKWLYEEDLQYITYALTPEPDYVKINLQPLFIENESFQPVRELIDKKFATFFIKLISLSKHKNEVKINKNKLLHVFYDIVFQRIIHDSYLMNAKEFINQSKKKIEKGDNDIYQRLIVKAGLEHFTPIIDGVFAIPDLVLAAFSNKSDLLNQKINKLNARIKPIAKRAKIMTGKKLTGDKRKMYLEIIKKQSALIKKYGARKQTASLNNAIRMHDKTLTDKQIKSIAETIRYHVDKGNLEN